MRVLAIIHHEVAGAGVFADAVTDAGHELEFWSPSDEPLPRALSLAEYGAVLAFGGGMHPDEDDRHPWLLTALGALRTCLSDGIPALGVCLGGQLLARAAGAPVGPAARPELGWLPVELTDAGLSDPLFRGLPPRFDVFQWHSYAFGVPADAVLLARSEVSPQALRIGDCAWALQWHPEVLGSSVLHWAAEYAPAPEPGGKPLDLEVLTAEVAARIDETNAAGRALCTRFLECAQERA
jgi:GMP synthase-like glutamine amidotransferase